MKPGKWIPVSEGLPKDRRSVLVYCPQYNNIYCASVHEDGKWYYFGQGVNRLVDEVITHWMLLPDAPKEDE